MVKCGFCGDFPGSLVYCDGWGVDTSEDWFPIQPHAFAFCDRCRGFIDHDDLEGLLGVTGMTKSSRALREFSASTGLLGPEAPYVAHVIDGAHRVYVLVTATHRTFNFKVSEWPDGLQPTSVSDEGTRCIVAFEDGSQATSDLDAEYVKWKHDHPSEDPDLLPA